MNKRRQSILFWIIFLIIVIIIAMFIFPNYGKLSRDLKISQARNIAANLTASTAANYTLRKVNQTKGAAIRNCLDVVNIVGDMLPSGYQIENQSIESDQVVFCTLTSPHNKAIRFSVIGIS